MPETPQSLYQRIEGLRGKKLVFSLLLVFVLFIFVGIAIGNFIPGLLKKDENIDWEKIQSMQQKESTSYKGKVVYIDPNIYPEDGISFYLADESGETIILLKTSDEKLTVVEGLNVLVFGEIGKTKNGQEQFLMVDKVVVKN